MVVDRFSDWQAIRVARIQEQIRRELNHVVSPKLISAILRAGEQHPKFPPKTSELDIIRKAFDAMVEKTREEAFGDAETFGPAIRELIRGLTKKAVLTFLSQLPNEESVTGPATDPVEIPKYYRISVLIADLQEIK